MKKNTTMFSLEQAKNLSVNDRAKLDRFRATWMVKNIGFQYKNVTIKTRPVLYVFMNGDDEVSRCVVFRNVDRNAVIIVKGNEQDSIIVEEIPVVSKSNASYAFAKSLIASNSKKVCGAISDSTRGFSFSKFWTLVWTIAHDYSSCKVSTLDINNLKASERYISETL